MNVKKKIWDLFKVLIDSVRQPVKNLALLAQLMRAYTGYHIQKPATIALTWGWFWERRRVYTVGFPI